MEWAIEAAALPVVCKDVLLALCRRMAQGTTWIPRQHCPSLRRLAEAAGWSKRHVLRALAYLEAAQVITRDRPTPHEARTRHVRTYYTIHYNTLAGLGTGSPTGARDTQSYGLGTPRAKAWDTATRELGTGSPQARDTAPPNQISTEPTDQGSDPETSFIRQHISDRLGVDVGEDQAEAIRARLLARPGAQDQAPLAYIRRTLTLDKHLEKWLEQEGEAK